MNEEQNLRCSSCGAAPGFEGTEQMIVCQFCGTQIPRPLPTAIVAEIAEPVEPEWMASWRDEISRLETERARKIVKLLGCIFLILLPGLGLMILGILALVAGETFRIAIACGLAGFIVAVAGIGSVVFQSISIAGTRKVLLEKRQRLETHRV